MTGIKHYFVLILLSAFTLSAFSLVAHSTTLTLQLSPGHVSGSTGIDFGIAIMNGTHFNQCILGHGCNECDVGEYADGPTCSYTYNSGQSIAMSAGTGGAGANYTFQDFQCSGSACSNGGYSGTNATPIITLNGNITETAYFAYTSSNLTANISATRNSNGTASVIVNATGGTPQYTIELIGYTANPCGTAGSPGSLNYGTAILTYGNTASSYKFTANAMYPYLCAHITDSKGKSYVTQTIQNPSMGVSTVTSTSSVTTTIPPSNTMTIVLSVPSFTSAKETNAQMCATVSSLYGTVAPYTVNLYEEASGSPYYAVVNSSIISQTSFLSEGTCLTAPTTSGFGKYLFYVTITDSTHAEYLSNSQSINVSATTSTTTSLSSTSISSRNTTVNTTTVGHTTSIASTSTTSNTTSIISSPTTIHTTIVNSTTIHSSITTSATSTIPKTSITSQINNGITAIIQFFKNIFRGL